MLNHPDVKDLISLALIVGVIYFGFKGGMILAFNNPSPMRGVVSNSMVPTFRRGDLLIIRGVSSASDIEENDIIVFNYPKEKQPIVHRVILIENMDNDGLKYITQGDANVYGTEVVYPGDVIGEVAFHIPYLGYPSVIF